MTMAKEASVKEMMDFLISKGVKKSEIADRVGVRWATVNLWERGMFHPKTKEHQQALQKLYHSHK